MSIPMGPHGRWVARHLQDTVCGAAQRAGVDRQSLNKFARGEPKVMGEDRQEAVYRVYRLTPRQFAWNVKVGWHGKKSYEPAGRKVASGQLSVGSGRRAEDGTGQSGISGQTARGQKSAIPNPQSKIENRKSRCGFAVPTCAGCRDDARRQGGGIFRGGHGGRARRWRSGSEDGSEE